MWSAYFDKWYSPQSIMFFILVCSVQCNVIYCQVLVLLHQECLVVPSICLIHTFKASIKRQQTTTMRSKVINK